MFRKTSLALALLGIGLVGSKAEAVVFNASQTIAGYTYAAQAEFTYDSLNNLLCIRLTNTAPVQAGNPGQTLSGIYFDVAGNPVLTKNSASVFMGSTIVNDVPNLNDALIGQEYAFRNNIGPAEASFTDAMNGISSTGLGIFSPGDRFDTSGNLGGPASGSVGGDDFSIVPAVQATFPGGLAGLPEVQDSMLFKLNTPTGFVLDIQHVAFHYGSGQEFPTIYTSVPEPGAVAMLIGMSVPGLLAVRRKQRASAKK